MKLLQERRWALPLAMPLALVACGNGPGGAGISTDSVGAPTQVSQEVGSALDTTSTCEEGLLESGHPFVGEFGRGLCVGYRVHGTGEPVLTLSYDGDALAAIPYDECSKERAKTIRGLTGVPVGDSDDAIFGYTSPDTAELVLELKGTEELRVRTFTLPNAPGVSYFAVLTPGHESVTSITELASDGSVVVKPQPSEASCAAQS